jgi:transcriptional antiterminator RfaH
MQGISTLNQEQSSLISNLQSDMHGHWHLVYTKVKKETEAERHLTNQGFDVYLPRHKIGVRKQNRYKEVIEPLFPRYIFVNLVAGVHNYAPIRSTRGAVGLVRVGSFPAIAPPSLIEYLRLKEQKALMPKPLNPFKTGDRVHIIDGPFAGYEAIYDCERGEERALILLNLMNQFSKVEMSVHHLVARAA